MASSSSATSGVILLCEFNAGETFILERDDGGGYAVVASLKGGTQEYTDVLPLDGVSRNYRGYVTKAGYANSATSGVVAATPQDLSIL